MIFPSTILLRFVAWIARRFGLEFDFSHDLLVDTLDDHEISEQLQYGRD